MKKSDIAGKIKSCGEDVKKYGLSFVKWVALAVVLGAVCGAVGVGLYYLVAWATEFRGSNPWIIYLLPVSGLAIIVLYRLLKMPKDRGTNLVISSIQTDEKVPFRMSALIFVGTAITHLFGGSAGREGAALQIGGGIGCGFAKLIRADETTRKVMTLCAMSAVFSAVFGTPITAAVFCIEVINVGVFYGADLLPCIVSSLTAYLLAGALGVKPERYVIEYIPGLSAGNLGLTAVLAAVCAVMSIVFCVVMHKTAHCMQKWIKNPYLRVIAGGVIIVALTLICGRDYNGAGGNIIAKAMGGQAVPYAFALKLVFTAVTLGAGFKGGEIVPSFFVGATLGCVLGPVLGLPASFSAAMCLVGVFCGVVNCPIASVVLGVELFGYGALPYFGLVCAISFFLSGEFSLYSSQKLSYAKFEPRFINRNAH